MRIVAMVLAATWTMALAGCGPGPTAGPAGRPAAEAPAPPPPPPPGKPSLPPDATPAAPSNSPTPPSEPPLSPDAKKAAVGAGKRGHYKDNPVTSPLTAPISARFRAEEKIAFDIQIPQAMKLYKALSPNGKGPETHAEFMTRIIEENSIRLPDLPPGEEYRYDPQTEELMVAPVR